MDYKEVNIQKAISYNSSAIKSVAYNPKRELFFGELASSEDIEQLIFKYVRVSFFRKMYMRLRGLLSRVKRKLFQY